MSQCLTALPPLPQDEVIIIESRHGVLGVHLHKPGLLVFVLLVHVQLDEVHLQVQGLDAHEDGPAVWGAWEEDNYYDCRN